MPVCLTEGAKLIELWDLFDAGIVAHIHCEHCGADGPSIYCEVGGVDALALARRCGTAGPNATSMSRRRWSRGRRACCEQDA